MFALSVSEIIDFITLPAIFILVFIMYLSSTSPKEFFIFFRENSLKQFSFLLKIG